MIAQATRISLSNLNTAFESQGAIYQSNNSKESNFFGDVTAIESLSSCVPVV
jgi:hypothetical protein